MNNVAFVILNIYKYCIAKEKGGRICIVDLLSIHLSADAVTLVKDAGITRIIC